MTYALPVGIGWAIGSALGALGILPPLPYPWQVWALIAVAVLVVAFAPRRDSLVAAALASCLYVWVLEVVNYETAGTGRHDDAPARFQSIDEAL